MRAYSRLLVPLVLFAACGGSSESPETAAMVEPPAAPVAAPEASDAREIDAAETDAMLEVLRADASADKQIVLIVSPGSPETVTLGAALETVFREGGWQPTTKRLTGMVLKPGPVRILVGEELEPPQVDSTRRALEAGGLTVETGTGYRAFYEEKKKENPNWPGIPMTPEQAFIVVIAPPPPAA
jgi:hypothetical protein